MVVIIFSCMIFFVTPLSISEKISTEYESMDKSNLNDILDGSWMEDKGDFKILFLNGTNYNMGYQYGYYLKTGIEENMRCVNFWCDYFGWTYNKRIDIWNIQKEYIPQCYHHEIQGMADGSGISFEEIAVYNIWFDLLNLPHCWGAALWGSATVDGNLYHMRSADGTYSATDPQTGKYFHENTALIIRNPKVGYASIDPEFIGDIFVHGGFNEKGIGVSELTIRSFDSQILGLSGGFRMRMVLDFASDITEAVEILNSNRTCGINFILSDANIPAGYAIEQSANLVYTGAWCDPVEATDPFWQIRDFVRRGNMCIHPLIAECQRKNYDPSGLNGLIKYLLKKNMAYVPWSQYRAISKEIANQHGTLDLNSTMTLFRDVYTGKTDLIFGIMQRLNYYRSGHQWVACPKTGDLKISFGTHTKNACDNNVYDFNLFDLLNYNPNNLKS